VVKRLCLALSLLVLSATVSAQAHGAVGIVRAETVLPSGPYRFGEAVTADLDVVVNTKLVDPDGLRAAVRFAPYEIVSEETSTADRGSATRVRFRYVLQCATLACTLAPNKRQRQIVFGPAVISYVSRDGKRRRTSVRWPGVVLVTRVTDAGSRPQTASEARQLPIDPLVRLPLSVESPPPTYRVRPATLALVLFGLAGIALFGAALLARPLVAALRREEAAEVPLSPLEQAVAAVETASQREPGSADHREALALLARQLRRDGLTELVNAARKLAWSEHAPSAAASRELTSDVRARMGGER
jgi:hypothetical protein